MSCVPVVAVRGGDLQVRGGVNIAAFSLRSSICAKSAFSTLPVGLPPSLPWPPILFLPQSPTTVGYIAVINYCALKYTQTILDCTNKTFWRIPAGCYYKRRHLNNMETRFVFIKPDVSATVLRTINAIGLVVFTSLMLITIHHSIVQILV